jgi:hypothetical protein
MLSFYAKNIEQQSLFPLSSIIYPFLEKNIAYSYTNLSLIWQSWLEVLGAMRQEL